MFDQNQQLWIHSTFEPVMDLSWFALVSLGSSVMTQGFCTYISSFLVISLPAALYGLSHHGLAVLLPASPLCVSSMPCSTSECTAAVKRFSMLLLVYQYLQWWLVLVLACYVPRKNYILERAELKPWKRAILLGFMGNISLPLCCNSNIHFTPKWASPTEQ